MARMRFNGPEGSRFEGLDLLMVRPGKAKLRDLAELQRATGLKMEQLQSELTANESMAMTVVIFLTLRNAGLMVSFDDAGEFAEDEIEVTPEPGDMPATEETEDPTSARTASVPGDDDAAAATVSHPKRAKTGSKARSGSDS